LRQLWLSVSPVFKLWNNYFSIIFFVFVWLRTNHFDSNKKNLNPQNLSIFHSGKKTLSLSPVYDQAIPRVLPSFNEEKRLFLFDDDKQAESDTQTDKQALHCYRKS